MKKTKAKVVVSRRSKTRKSPTSVTHNNISVFLEDRRMSQKDLAEKVGTNVAHISKIVNQDCPQISLPIAMKIADALGTSVSELFTLSKDDVKKEK